MANTNSSVFPTGIAADSDLLVMSDNAFSTLSNAITNSDTTLPFTQTSSFKLPCYLGIENEIIKANGPIVNSAITNCVRGAQGTVAAAHASGITGFGYIFATHINQLSAEIKAIETLLGINGGNILKTNSAAGNDLTGNLPNPSVASVGGVSAASVASATLKAHIQNTDTATANPVQIGVGNGQIKGISTTSVGVVTNAGTAYGDFYADTLFTGQYIRLGDSDYSKAHDIIVSGPHVGIKTSGSALLYDWYRNFWLVEDAVTGQQSGLAFQDTAVISTELTGTVKSPQLHIANYSPGSFGDGSHVPTLTVNAKGLVNASGQTQITMSAAAGRLKSSSVTSVPTLTGGPAAGTSPFLQIIGNDSAGQITFAPGTSPAATGNILTLTFGTTFTSNIIVMLTPVSSSATSLTVANVPIVNYTYPVTGSGAISITNFKLDLGTGSSVLPAPPSSQFYSWNYMVVEI